MENIINFVSVDELYLDPDNPRLPTTVDRSNDSMLDYIARHFSIEELMQAIGVNGYFPGEPLLVVPRERGGFTVVEGNRRLTAVKLLNTPELVAKRSIKCIADDAEGVPKSLPVVQFNEREDILTYLGHRHITGVKAWKSLAKARYLRELFDSLKIGENEDEKFGILAKKSVVGEIMLSVYFPL